MVGVREETGEHLLLASMHAPLVLAEVGPSGDPRGTLGGRVILGDQAHGALVGDHLVSPGIPTVIEGAGVAIRPFGGNLVGGVHGPEGEIGIGGLAGS